MDGMQGPGLLDGFLHKYFPDNTPKQDPYLDEEYYENNPPPVTMASLPPAQRVPESALATGSTINEHPPVTDAVEHHARPKGGFLGNFGNFLLVFIGTVLGPILFPSFAVGVKRPARTRTEPTPDQVAWTGVQKNHIADKLDAALKAHFVASGEPIPPQTAIDIMTLMTVVRVDEEWGKSLIAFNKLNNWAGPKLKALHQMFGSDYEYEIVDPYTHIPDWILRYTADAIASKYLYGKTHPGHPLPTEASFVEGARHRLRASFTFPDAQTERIAVETCVYIARWAYFEDWQAGMAKGAKHLAAIGVAAQVAFGADYLWQQAHTKPVDERPTNA